MPRIARTAYLACRTLLASAALMGVTAAHSTSAQDGRVPHTPTADEPPRMLGPRYDHDDAVSKHARPVASYDLSVTLDEGLHRLSGTGRIHWTNASSEPISELYFHLYLNAFRDERSLFLRSPFNRGRSGEGATSPGSITLTRLVAPRLGGNLLASIRPADPEEAADGTDVRVDLPSAIAPGESLDLELGWDAELPRIVERTGHAGDFHMVAQWFPKLAKLDATGTWAHFPFHAQSEFYADFGTYDVEIDVPESFVVGATGKLVSSRTEVTRKRVSYHASDVHDFAWTAWPGFRERVEEIDGVEVRLLHPTGFEKNASLTLDAVRFGLGYFGAAYGRYPYPTLTVVIPPETAANAGGMEYPTLITTGGHWYTPYVSHGIELLTLHELAHQWFYGLVATNEYAWPFLDEGLASYAEALAVNALFGPGSAVDLFDLRIDADAYRRCAAAKYEHDDVVGLPAAGFSSFGELGALVYARTTILLQTLGNVFGEAALHQALGRYARRYRFEHPTPRHWLAALGESLGSEARQVAELALFEGGWIDYAALDLRNVERTTTTDASADPGSSPGDEERWYAAVVIKRRGTLPIPVDVDLVDSTGKVERRHLDGRARTFSLEYRGPFPLDRVVVDPELRIPLDSNLLNNAARRTTAYPIRVHERLAYWTHLLLAGLGP